MMLFQARRIAKSARLLAVVAGAAGLVACASDTGTVAGGSTFATVSPAASSVPTGQTAQYRLGPFDKISVNVYGQKDLGVDKAQIDSSGNVALPLVGVIQASGLTAQELSTEIASRLSKTYMKDPYVSVLVDETASQVTVTGAVVEAGVFKLTAPTSLVQALAMAKGVDNKAANTKRVAVFRTINGARNVAVFDLAAIQSGQAADPEVVRGDTIIVPDSRTKGLWREILGVIPALNVFALYQ